MKAVKEFTSSAYSQFGMHIVVLVNVIDVDKEIEYIVSSPSPGPSI